MKQKLRIVSCLSALVLTGCSHHPIEKWVSFYPRLEQEKSQLDPSLRQNIDYAIDKNLRVMLIDTPLAREKYPLYFNTTTTR